MQRGRKDVIPRGLLILGFGGHARSVGDVALDLGIPALAFVEAGARAGEEFAGFPVRTAIPDSLEEEWRVFAAAGDNAERRRQIEDTAARGLPTTRLISKRAYLGTGAIVQDGSFVAHHAHIGPLASVGRGTIINTAAVVDHESRIGDFTHISVNATVAGRCRIGNMVFLGAGAIVIDRIRIVDRVVIGAGATIIDDITEPGIYVGSPARRVSS
jgi:sugar O-acyltransferase (sialic acid O-acetyltransferase NeuD family)